MDDERARFFEELMKTAGVSKSGGGMPSFWTGDIRSDVHLPMRSFSRNEASRRYEPLVVVVDELYDMPAPKTPPPEAIIDKVHHKPHKKLDALAAQNELRRQQKAKILGISQEQQQRKRAEAETRREAKRREKELQAQIKKNQDFGSW